MNGSFLGKLYRNFAVLSISTTLIKYGEIWWSLALQSGFSKMPFHISGNFLQYYIQFLRFGLLISKIDSSNNPPQRDWYIRNYKMSTEISWSIQNIINARKHWFKVIKSFLIQPFYDISIQNCHQNQNRLSLKHWFLVAGSYCKMCCSYLGKSEHDPWNTPPVHKQYQQSKRIAGNWLGP